MCWPSSLLFAWRRTNPHSQREYVHTVYLSIEASQPILDTIALQFARFKPVMHTYTLRIYTKDLDDAKFISDKVREFVGDEEITINFFDMYQFLDMHSALQFNSNVLHSEGAIED